jgi:hypothetical protein
MAIVAACSVLSNTSKSVVRSAAKVWSSASVIA